MYGNAQRLNSIIIRFAIDIKCDKCKLCPNTWKIGNKNCMMMCKR